MFLWALKTRLAFALTEHPVGAHLSSDMANYRQRADHLLSGSLGLWDTFTPVGYPAFVALLMRISDNSMTLIGVVQACLGAWSCVLISRIVLRLDRGREGGQEALRWSTLALAASAGVMAELHLPSVFYSGLALTECATTFLLLLACEKVLVGLDRRMVDLLVGGLLLGVGVSMRPNLLLVAPAMLLVIARYAIADARRPRRGRFIATGLFALGCLVPVGLAVRHQSSVARRLVGISTNGGLNLYLNFAPARGALFNEGSVQHNITPIPNLYRYQQDELLTVPFYDDAYYYRRAWQLVKRDPSRLTAALDNFPMAAGLRELHYWPGYGPWEARLTRFDRLFFCGVLLPALANCLLFLVFAGKRRRENAVRLLAVSICLLSLVPIYCFLGDPRLRVPFDGLFILLAVDFHLRLLVAMGRLVRLGARLVPTPTSQRLRRVMDA